MLYYLFDYLNELGVPGAGVFQYSTFRTSMAVVTSLIISMFFGKRIIRMLQLKQVGETVRDLGLEGQIQKQGTPTMGGLIILASIIIPTLLFAKLNNIYILLLLVSTVLLGLIGFLDDYIKVFKKNKEGLKGKFKVIGQVGIGLMVGTVLYFHDDVRIRESVPQNYAQHVGEEIFTTEQGQKMHDVHSMQTTIPFIKNNEFNYSWFLTWINKDWAKYAWLIFIPIVILIVTAVSNGANMTDGLDGLAAGTSAIIGVALAVFAFVSGNYIFADYLNIMFIPEISEVVIFTGAFVGACIGFLWYNSYPAQVFMGDTGSLALGGIIAIIALAVRKELILPVLCGVFLVENLSVMLQVSYFKYTKNKYGEGRRIFKMSPIHHHFQKLGMHEAKIVTRFWIVGIILAVLSIVTLKLR
jgi:phospho-N-acetylmuramoyl-pentapeptide-transferase